VLLHLNLRTDTTCSSLPHSINTWLSKDGYVSGFLFSFFMSSVFLFIYVFFVFFSMSSAVCVLFFWLLEFDVCVILW
jgi:hypothetical protein